MTTSGDAHAAVTMAMAEGLFTQIFGELLKAGKKPFYKLTC